MAEWSKALVLGTSHFDGVGSNPTAATTLLFLISIWKKKRLGTPMEQHKRKLNLL